MSLRGSVGMWRGQHYRELASKDLAAGNDLRVIDQSALAHFGMKTMWQSKTLH
jgi:hypothetical protein